MPTVPPPTHLHAFDLALIVVYLIGITLFGLRFRSGSDPKSRSLRSYFLADQTIPWWAIALSIVSAETSTLTIISVPGVAFAGDFGFLQIVIGYMLGRIVVALLFLPKYFQGSMLTAYQLIDQRFGPTLHKVTAGLFLLTRAAAEGVRVFAVSIVVGIAIGTRDVLSIAIISALTLLYTFEGGIAAVIWTDVVQMAIYIGGTLVAIYTLGEHIPGGWGQIHAVAAAADKFRVFHFALNLTQSYTFWAGVLGGTFLTMASHGTDQLMVQRMLAARNLRESRIALLASGGVIFLQFTLFLLIGAGLYVFYGLHPAVFASADRIFPTFIVREMPVGIAGLLVAAILAAAMSNLSAALNSLSSTTVVDFYMHWRPNADDRERMMISRASTVVWAFVLFAVAVYSVFAGGKGHVVEIGLSIASVAYGALLGVFLLGDADALRYTVGGDCGDDLRVCAKPPAVARSISDNARASHDSAYRLHLVCADRIHRHIRSWLCGELRVALRRPDAWTKGDRDTRCWSNPCARLLFPVVAALLCRRSCVIPRSSCDCDAATI
ncbi:MAG: sodium:solute symporter [Edaphobacter sp.]